MQIATEARVGGMLSGKAGKVHVHVGDGATLLEPLWDIVNNTSIPITQLYVKIRNVYLLVNRVLRATGTS